MSPCSTEKLNKKGHKKLQILHFVDFVGPAEWSGHVVGHNKYYILQIKWGFNNGQSKFGARTTLFIGGDSFLMSSIRQCK